MPRKAKPKRKYTSDEDDSQNDAVANENNGEATMTNKKRKSKKLSKSCAQEAVQDQPASDSDSEIIMTPRKSRKTASSKKEKSVNRKGSNDSAFLNRGSRSRSRSRSNAVNDQEVQAEYHEGEQLITVTVNNPCASQSSEDNEANRNFVQLDAEESEEGEIDMDPEEVVQEEPPVMSKQDRIKQIDAEMKERIEELHKLMSDGGLQESAELLGKMMVPNRERNRDKNGDREGQGQSNVLNTNDNASKRIVEQEPKEKQPAADKSLETIYESVVPKRISSSSEEEFVNTSGDSVNPENIVNDFIADIRSRGEGRSQGQGRNDRYHYTRPVQQTRYADAQPSTSSGRGRNRDEGPDDMVTPEERAEDMIKQAETAKARIFATPGKQNLVPHPHWNSPPEMDRGFMPSSSMMDEGFIVVGAHLDDTMINKICSGDYVDFGKLLPRDRIAVEEESRLEMVIKNGRTYWAPVHSGVNITGFGKWEQAFRVYSNIYCKQSPARAAELIEYNHVIYTIATHYVWENVYAYDKDFRLHMARNPARSWSIILQQAWSLRLRDRLTGNTNGFQSGGNNRVRSNEPCRRFNRGKCNFGTNCKYEHRCNYCNKFGHGAVNCRKAIADRNHSNNGNNNHYQGGGGTSGSNHQGGPKGPGDRKGNGGGETTKPIQVAN